MTAQLYGNEVESPIKNSSQVYQVTHGEGGKRLPSMYRSFISFSYGGKVIEDYNLLAYTEGDSIDRPSYGNFDDISETYDVVDGQLYWGSHFTDNKLTLNIVTDGITERQLDDFKTWFRPGVTRELILAEHPNRAIMARIAEPPEFSFLPFEKVTSTMIAGRSYETSVTEYKGTGTITFVADDPFWYARYNLLMPQLYGEGIYGVLPINLDIDYVMELINSALQLILKIKYVKNGTEKEELIRISSVSKYDGYWQIKGINDEEASVTLNYPEEIKAIMGGVVILQDKDYIKVIIEDNIPHLAMIKDNCILGDSLIIEDIKKYDTGAYIFNTTNVVRNNLNPHSGARINMSWIYFNNAVLTSTINLSKGDTHYLYYPGTAPSRPKLSFTFTPHYNSEDYISEPLNKVYAGSKSYSYLAIDDEKFEFTTPAILTGYNQAVKIVSDFSNGQSVIDLLLAIKEGVHEYYARAWAVACINALSLNQSYATSAGAIININGFKTQFIAKMKCLIGTGNSINPVSVYFDCKTGETTGAFSIRVIPEDAVITSSTAFSSFSFYSMEENVGDMVKSDYLRIDGRNYPNFDGYVTYKDCHKVTTNYSSGLQDLKIDYKVLYY